MENVSINFTIELPELTQDWGNRLLEGTNGTLCAPGPRGKEQGPHKRLRHAHECVGVSSRSVGRQWPTIGLGSLSVAARAWDLLQEVTIVFTIVWPQIK